MHSLSIFRNHCWTNSRLSFFPLHLCFHILTYNSWGKKESNTVSVIKDEVYLAVPKAQWRWLWSSFCWVMEWKAKPKQRIERNNRNYKTTSGRNRQRKIAWKRRIFLLLEFDVSGSQPTGMRECRKREKYRVVWPAHPHYLPVKVTPATIPVQCVFGLNPLLLWGPFRDLDGST